MTFPEKKDAESWANAMEKRIDLCGASIRKQTLEQRIGDWKLVKANGIDKPALPGTR